MEVFGRDRAGNMFATMLLCSLSNETKALFSDNVHASSFFSGIALPEDTHIKAELLTSFEKGRRTGNFGQLTIAFSSHSVSPELVTRLSSGLEDFDRSHVVEHGEKNSFSIALKELEGQSIIALSFNNNKECWDTAFKVVLQLKYNNTSRIKRIKPVLNDFNEDISLKKGKHPRYVLKALEGEQILVKRDNPVRSTAFGKGNNPQI